MESWIWVSLTNNNEKALKCKPSAQFPCTCCKKCMQTLVDGWDQYACPTMACISQMLVRHDVAGFLLPLPPPPPPKLEKLPTPMVSTTINVLLAMMLIMTHTNHFIVTSTRNIKGQFSCNSHIEARQTGSVAD